MGDISGGHAWNGAVLAAREINEAGGIVINGTRYFIGLVSEDTEEMAWALDIVKANNSAKRLIEDHSPHFVTGGFRTEAVLAYQEVIMDAKIPFLSTGVVADEFCQNVLNDYDHYKYFFRIMPYNTTSLINELILYILYLSDYFNRTYGASTIKVGILREDLSWTIPIASALQSQLPVLNSNISIVSNTAFPVTVSAFQMSNYLASLDALGAQIIIPIISSPGGIHLGVQYGTIQPGYLLAGINTLAQLDSYWENTAGGCNYEIIMQSLYNVSKTSKSKSFWNNFYNNFSEEPYYTGIGSYGAVNLLANTVFNTQSFNSSNIIMELEKINATNSFLGPSGNLAFSGSHDLIAGWPYATSLFCQWYGGSKTVLSTGDSIYPESIPTGYLKIPPWGINGFGPSLLPGDFNVYNNADNPDPDGIFNLTWTSSINADNYSIYRSTHPITYINDDLILVADQTALSPFEISGLKTGDHYFVIVANNEYGIKMSDCTHISVLLPAPGNFLLDTDADDPDTDGIFNINWTNSDGANNYSIYTSQAFISEINENLILLANQNAISPYSISNRKTGIHYFVVVAYNSTGMTLSNCINVSVLLPAPGDFILSSNAGNPNLNGEFDLFWTNSDGADNYSLYTFSEYISQINFSVDLLANQNAVSPTSISGLTQGEYYYLVVAFNETGETMSNCLHLEVYLSAPKDFTLSTNAGDPDTDGVFDLTWSDSFAAENYSVYQYESLIVELNQTLDELAFQSATSPFQITDLSNGTYYFIVVAHNENGQTLSNNVHVIVQISPPDDDIDNGNEIISGYNLLIFISVFSIISIIVHGRYSRQKKQI